MVYEEAFYLFKLLVTLYVAQSFGSKIMTNGISAVTVHDKGDMSRHDTLL